MNRALLVGINTYPTAPLFGCVNDVLDMAAFLNTKCGFDANEIRLLTDDRATRINILDRIGWLMTNLRSGDRVLFHMSCHATRLATRNSQGIVDAIYEAVCPVDFDWTVEGNNAIRDKDFARIFSSIPEGVEFIWVSDTCHAQGLSRAMSLIPNVTRSRSMFMPADLKWRLDTAIQNGIKARGLRGVATELNLALMAACRTEQEAADTAFDGRPNGAYTFLLLKALGEAGGLNKSIKNVTEALITSMVASGFVQQPQVEGNPAIVQRAFLHL